MIVECFSNDFNNSVADGPLAYRMQWLEPTKHSNKKIISHAFSALCGACERSLSAREWNALGLALRHDILAIAKAGILGQTIQATLSRLSMRKTSYTMRAPQLRFTSHTINGMPVDAEVQLDNTRQHLAARPVLNVKMAKRRTKKTKPKPLSHSLTHSLAEVRTKKCTGN